MTTWNYQQTHFVTSAPDIRHLPSDTGIEVAFAGRSNAGKSSALNTLTNQKNLARTSKTPGRTQLINLFEVAEGKRLVDLPGYGYAQVPEEMKIKWQRALGEYLEKRMCLKGLVVLMDMPVELSEQLMRKREQSTGTHADIHERDEDYLKKCRDVALHAAKYYGWRTVSCAKDGAIRGVEDIHEEVYAIVKSCLED